MTPTPTMERDSLVARLEPCPFCGNDGSGPIEDALHVVHNEPDYVHDHRHTWSVQCDKCTATMGYSDSDEEAIEAWNRRAAAALSRPEQVVTDEELQQRMLKQVAKWENEEPREDWWQYQRDFEKAALCLTTAAPLQADASAPASPAIGVQAVTLDFHTADTTPDVPRGQMKACIIMMRSRHTGKNFTMPAYYLNAYPLEFEDGCGDEKCEDEHDDGCPVTGWFYDNANFEYENCYYRIEGECLAWALIPDAASVEAALHPAPEAASAGAAGEIHPDDLAVDRFAAAMKAKLAKKRAEGRGGWEGATCNAGILSRLLREHVEKGDPLDVGNLSMMLHQRGERIAAPSPKGVSDGVREAVKPLTSAIQRIVDENEDFRVGMPGDWAGDPLQDAIEDAHKVAIATLAALSQEPVPATAEERAAQEKEAR